MYVTVIKHVIFCKADMGAAVEFLLYQRKFSISVPGLENVVELIFSRLKTHFKFKYYYDRFIKSGYTYTTNWGRDFSTFNPRTFSD